MNTQPITLQLSPELLAQAQEIAGNVGLHNFLIRTIENEIQRCKPSVSKKEFWESVKRLRAQMQAEGIEIDLDRIWGNVRDRSPGREVTL